MPYHTYQREREDADRKKREFFKEMENNMRRNVANGQLSSDIFAGAKVRGWGVHRLPDRQRPSQRPLVALGTLLAHAATTFHRPFA